MSLCLQKLTSMANIRDTNWSHTDPLKMLSSVSKMKKELMEDTMYTFGLITTTIIPFVSPFSKLQYEVGFHCFLERRAFFDIKGNWILDFINDGIKEAFKWSNEGVIYTNNWQEQVTCSSGIGYKKLANIFVDKS